MELFPCDDYDVARGLQNLERAGFISVYQIAHFNVAQVLSFLVHQVPHGTEKDSELPDINGVLTVNERKDNGYITGKKSVVTVEQLLSNGVLTVKQLFLNALNPESLILNPDTPPNPPKGNGRGRRAREEDSTPYQAICDAYRTALPNLPQPTEPAKWTKARKSAVKARWDEASERQDLEWWKSLFAYVGKSAFLTGKTPQEFEASFDWLMKPANLIKVLEGNYHKVLNHG